MATISSEGPVFVYDTRPSTQLAVIGYTGVSVQYKNDLNNIPYLNVVYVPY